MSSRCRKEVPRTRRHEAAASEKRSDKKKPGLVASALSVHRWVGGKSAFQGQVVRTGLKPTTAQLSEFNGVAYVRDHSTSDVSEKGRYLGHRQNVAHRWAVAEDARSRISPDRRLRWMRWLCRIVQEPLAILSCVNDLDSQANKGRQEAGNYRDDEPDAVSRLEMPGPDSDPAHTADE